MLPNFLEKNSKKNPKILTSLKKKKRLIKMIKSNGVKENEKNEKKEKEKKKKEKNIHILPEGKNEFLKKEDYSNYFQKFTIGTIRLPNTLIHRIQKILKGFFLFLF